MLDDVSTLTKSAHQNTCILDEKQRNDRDAARQTAIQDIIHISPINCSRQTNYFVGVCACVCVHAIYSGYFMAEMLHCA